LDFPQTTAKKIHAIERTPAVKSLLLRGPQTPGVHVSEDGTALSSPLYHVHPVDLRELASWSPAEDALGAQAKSIPHVNPSTPTLILSECCLTYLSCSIGSSVLKHITSTMLHQSTPALAVLYEPLHPNDSFGRTMTRNLGGRGIDMPSLLELETLEAHGSRLKGCLGPADDGNLGWSGLEIRQVWKQWVTQEEKERLRVLEGLDEEEEWELLAGHYGVVWAWRGMDGSRLGGGILE